MNESDPLQTGEAASMELPPSARRMLRVVYIMGIVLVLPFVAAIIWKANHKAPPKPEPPPQNLYLGLPPGAAITSASLDGDRLVITTAHEVIVVDVKKNVIISRIAAAP
jgi:hypothetical protein